jgi:hypothetical protein
MSQRLAAVRLHIDSELIRPQGGSLLKVKYIGVNESDFSIKY